MNNNALSLIVIFWCACSSVFGQATILYQTDFSEFSNGDLNAQDGWEAQADWQVNNGMITNAGSWQRARLIDGFTMQPGDAVRATMLFSLSGSPSGNEIARFGLAKSNEHTGENMPQVFAPVTWTGSSLQVGGATINNYSSGDLVSVEMTFSMQKKTDSWELSSILTNITDSATGDAVSVLSDEAGTVTSETAWGWLNGGGEAYFGIRNFNNPTGIQLSIAEVIFEIDVTDSTTNSVTPNILNVENGDVASGELGDVVESDDQYLEFFPSPPASKTNLAPIDLEFTAFLPNESFGSLTVDFEASANTVGLLQVLEMFNWNSQQYDLVDARVLTFQDDEVVSTDLSVSIANYVDASTGRVRIRSRWQPTSPTLFYPWKVSVDQVILSFK